MVSIGAVVHRRMAPSATQVVSGTVSSLFVLIVAYPLVRTLVELFRGDLATSSNAPGIWGTLTSSSTVTALWHTIVIVGISATVAMFIGAGFAWLNERTNARLGFAADTLPLLSMFVPTLASAIGWVFLANPDVGALNVGAQRLLSSVGVHVSHGPLNIFTWYGLIFVYTLQLVPFAYLSASNGLKALDPSLEASAGLCGASPFRIFRQISIPVMRPALFGGLTLVLMMGLSFFAIPVVIGAQARISVLSLNIVNDVTQAYPPNLNGATAQALLLLLILLAVQGFQARYAASGRGYATISGKGVRSARVDLGRWRWVARAIMVLYLLLASVVPFAALLAVSLEKFWTRSISLHIFGMFNYRDVLNRPELHDALKNSITFGIIGGLIVVSAAFCIGIYLEHGRPVGRRIVSVGLRVPPSVTHILVALSFIVGFGGAPFYWTATDTILVLAYVVLNIPQASFYISPAIKQVGASLSEASTLSGATEGRTLARIVLPLVAPGIIVGWTISFVLIMGDVTASSMLASVSTPVVGFTMVDEWTNGTYPATAALGVIITLIASIVATIPLALRRRLRVAS